MSFGASAASRPISARMVAGQASRFLAFQLDQDWGEGQSQTIVAPGLSTTVPRHWPGLSDRPPLSSIPAINSQVPRPMGLSP
jgi:hypothetical protein